jgi:hypothetical protein
MAEVERSGGNGGVYAMLVVVVILIIGVALYFSGAIGNRGSTDANIDVNIETPAAPGGDGN